MTSKFLYITSKVLCITSKFLYVTSKFLLSTPWGCMGEVELYLHSFLASVIDCVEWLTLRAVRFTSRNRNEPWHPLNGRLYGSQRQIEQFGEDKSPLPLPVFECKTVQLLALCIYRQSYPAYPIYLYSNYVVSGPGGSVGIAS